MERKLKVSEFAELVGITSKTVYKMESRGEITTVNERVNNRPTMLVITNDEQIRHFRSQYSKAPFASNNYEENVTINNESMSNNNPSQSTNNNEFVQDMFDRIITLNEEYNNRIEKLNNELIDSKSKLLLLEDKTGREGLLFNEINELKKENEQLKTEKTNVANTLVAVIVVLLMVLVGLITYNVSTIKKERTQQEITQPVSKETVTGNKQVKSARLRN